MTGRPAVPASSDETAYERPPLEACKGKIRNALTKQTVSAEYVVARLKRAEGEAAP